MDDIDGALQRNNEQQLMHFVDGDDGDGIANMMQVDDDLYAPRSPKRMRQMMTQRTAAMTNDDLLTDGVIDDGMLLQAVTNMTTDDAVEFAAGAGIEAEDLVAVPNPAEGQDQGGDTLESYLATHPYLQNYVKDMNTPLATSLDLPKFIVFYPDFFEEIRTEQERLAGIYKNAAQMRDLGLGTANHNFFFVALHPPNATKWKRALHGDEMDARKRERDAVREQQRAEAAERRAARPKRTAAVAAANALEDVDPPIIPDGLRPVVGNDDEDVAATTALLLGGGDDDDDDSTKKKKKKQANAAQKRKASAMEVADNREMDRQNNEHHWWSEPVPQSAMLKHPDDPEHPLLYAELPQVLREPSMGGFDVSLDQMKKPGVVDILTKEQEYQYVGRYRGGAKKDHFAGWQTQVSFPNRGVVYLALTWEARLGALAAFVAKIDPRLRNKESVHAWMRRMASADGDAHARLWLDEMEDNLRNADTRVKAGGGRKRKEGGLPEDHELLHMGYIHPTLVARPPPPPASDEEMAVVAERLAGRAPAAAAAAANPPPPPPPALQDVPPVADANVLPPILPLPLPPGPIDSASMRPDLGFLNPTLTDDEAQLMLLDTYNGETTHQVAEELRKEGATAQQLREVLGFDDDVIVNVYTPDELKTSGFSAADLLSRGISLQNVLTYYTAEEVRLAGF